MKKTSYYTLLDKLYSIKANKDTSNGLKRMRDALALLGNPHTHFQSIHIAGTNGKGSVAWKTAEGLIQEGRQVGLFTSPHIETYNERIQVNGTTIDEDEIVTLLPQVFDVGEGCTFFELTTLLAFLYFSKKKIEYAVIEAGVGGRLDATNVLQPILSVITSISLDHTEWLGSTIEAIALEKSGIIKQNTPLVIGKSVPEIVEKIAAEKNAQITQVVGDFVTYDAENMGIAKKCLEVLKVSPQAISQGIKKMPPCRMEVIYSSSVPIIFDVAHNPAGFASLFPSLKNKYGWDRFRVILGMGKDKDYKTCMSYLTPHAVEVFLVEAKGVRPGVPVATLQKILLELNYGQSHACGSVKDAVDRALELSTIDNLPILVLGTFYIMADAKSKFNDS